MPPRSARLGSGTNATSVIDPIGEHKATIVWLHSLNEDGSIWKSQLEQLNIPNIKWICPTAPTRPIPGVAGFNAATWCDYDMGVVCTEESPYDDLGGLDASATRVANLLSTEPAGIKLGVGGIGVGAAIALHSATCFARGQYHNGSAYPPINLTAILALNGWLPQASGCLRSSNPDGQSPAVS
ncbi:acyl-protein thioesterase 2-like [Salvia splendens]|uniref:acyl-protein thioesterase 2-like n=1 Tax=Salvia splendens TaxID=180675 RepID=UPI001C2647BF|nr:acyl-protein thioesterase 2-like [Salvia splendens]